MQVSIRFTLRQLQYLVTCIDTGSLAAAAERLNISQPSISTAIAKLEAELGVQLLLRHHAQGVTPTASAERLLQSARSLLSHAADLQRHAKASGDMIAGDLRLGSFITLAPAFLPGLMAELKQHYPALRLQLGEGTQTQLIDGLRQGRHELALLYDLDLPDDLRSTELAKVAPYILLSENHPLAGQEDIAMADLADEPLILLDVPPSRDYFTSLLEDAGIEPRIAFSSPSLELVRGLVGRGLGYSLLVTRPSGDISYDGQSLAVCAVREPVKEGRIVLSALRALRPTRVMSVFEAFAASYFSTALRIGDSSHAGRT
ncbi:MAG: LysR family transcriptional regulator [Geminicoccaceae bacterium]